MSSSAAFDKAVQIVKDLPPEGDVKPSQDDQLAVSTAYTLTHPFSLDQECYGNQPDVES